MIRDLARAFVLVMTFLIVVAEIERMDNEVTTDWSSDETQIPRSDARRDPRA